MNNNLYHKNCKFYKICEAIVLLPIPDCLNCKFFVIEHKPIIKNRLVFNYWFKKCFTNI